MCGLSQIKAPHWASLLLCLLIKCKFCTVSPLCSSSPLHLYSPADWDWPGSVILLIFFLIIFRHKAAGRVFLTAPQQVRKVLCLQGQPICRGKGWHERGRVAPVECLIKTHAWVYQWGCLGLWPQKLGVFRIWENLHHFSFCSKKNILLLQCAVGAGFVQHLNKDKGEVNCLAHHKAYCFQRIWPQIVRAMQGSVSLWPLYPIYLTLRSHF